jgi:uncharacterized membrane protein
MDRKDATMDAYSLVKFLHVTFAIIWLGGQLCLTLLGWRAIRTNDAAGLTKILEQIAYIANQIFIPSALLTLISGVFMAWAAGLFGDVWVIVGLGGYLAIFVLGIAVLKPRLEKVSALIAKDSPSAAALDRASALFRIAEFEAIVLFAVVADMVTKPTPTDYVVLIIIALAVAAAGIVLLRPVIPAATRRA